MFRDLLSVIGVHCLVYFLFNDLPCIFLLYDPERAEKMIYSVQMPLLARWNQKSDPTSPITPIPKGNQNDTVTQERLQNI